MSKNFELLQQSQEQELFRVPGAPAAPKVALVRDRTPLRPEEHSPKTKPSLPINWLNRMKEGARTLKQVKLRNKVQVRNKVQPQEKVQFRDRIELRNNCRETDLELITREEQFRLVQRLFRPASGSSPQVVLFCGIEADAGSSSICANTCEILAEQIEEPVCIIDANFDSPCLDQYFGIDNSRGLAEALLESDPIMKFAQQLRQRNLQRNLWVMPSGAGARQRTLLVSEKLRSRMTELRAEFKHVVVNASPMGRNTSSILLSQWTDGVVLVVEANETRRDSARRVKENLEAADVKMLGVVLNNRTFPIPNSLYRRM